MLRQRTLSMVADAANLSISEQTEYGKIDRAVTVLAPRDADNTHTSRITISVGRRADERFYFHCTKPSSHVVSSNTALQELREVVLAAEFVLRQTKLSPSALATVPEKFSATELYGDSDRPSDAAALFEAWKEYMGFDNLNLGDDRRVYPFFVTQGRVYWDALEALGFAVVDQLKRARFE